MADVSVFCSGNFRRKRMQDRSLSRPKQDYLSCRWQTAAPQPFLKHMRVTGDGISWQQRGPTNTKAQMCSSRSVLRHEFVWDNTACYDADSHHEQRLESAMQI